MAYMGTAPGSLRAARVRAARARARLGLELFSKIFLFRLIGTVKLREAKPEAKRAVLFSTSDSTVSAGCWVSSAAVAGGVRVIRASFAWASPVSALTLHAAVLNKWVESDNVYSTVLMLFLLAGRLYRFERKKNVASAHSRCLTPNTSPPPRRVSYK